MRALKQHIFSLAKGESWSLLSYFHNHTFTNTNTYTHTHPPKYTEWAKNIHSLSANFQTWRWSKTMVENSFYTTILL